MMREKRKNQRVVTRPQESSPKGTVRNNYLQPAKSCSHFPSSSHHKEKTASIKMPNNKNKKPHYPQKPYKQSPKISKQRVLMQLIEKFMVGVSSQLDHQIKTTTQSAQIRLNNLQLLRVREIKQLLIDIGQFREQQRMQSRQRYQQKERTQPFNSPLMTQYIDREKFVKKQLTKIIQKTTRKPYIQRSVIQMVNHVGQIIQNLTKSAASNSRLQFQSKKVRNYYLHEVQNCREQVRFLHELVQLKEKELAHLSDKVSLMKDRNEIEEEAGLKKNQSPIEAMRNVQSQPSRLIQNRFSQVQTIQFSKLPKIQQNQPFNAIALTNEKKGMNSGIHLNQKLDNNPQSHQKSKSDILDSQKYQNIHEQFQKQAALYSQLGQVNSRMNQLNELLKQKLQQSQNELSYKHEKIQALNCQSNLLEENIGNLTDTLTMKQDQLQGKQQLFFDLSQAIIFKQHELDLIEQQLQILQEQKDLETQNLQRVQSHLQCLEEECELLEQQIQSKRSQI